MARPENHSGDRESADDELRGTVITEVILPADADRLYGEALIDLKLAEKHSLIVMLGNEPEPGATQINVLEMRVVPNPLPNVRMKIAPALEAALEEARRTNPELVVLGYGTVAAYESEAIAAFASGKRLHLVGGDIFHTVSRQGVKAVDWNEVKNRPGFGIYTAGASGEPVKVNRLPLG